MSSAEFMKAAREPYKQLFKYILPYKGRFFMGIAFGALFGVVNGAMIWVIKFAGDQVFGSKSAVQDQSAAGPPMRPRSQTWILPARRNKIPRFRWLPAPAVRTQIPEFRSTSARQALPATRHPARRRARPRILSPHRNQMPSFRWQPSPTAQTQAPARQRRRVS